MFRSTAVEAAPLTKLTDVAEYRAAAERLNALTETQANLKSQIADHEARLRQDPDTVDPLALGKLQRELVTVQRSIAAQEQVVSNARAGASKQICTTFAAEHNGALREAVLAVISANVSAVKAVRIRDRLSANDVMVHTLPVIMLQGLGPEELQDSCSRLSYLIREALSVGIIERKDVPAEWLRGWGL